MSEWQAGWARREITAWEPEMQIWGWFMPDNRVEGVATPLYARACVLRRERDAIAYVCADLGYISVAVREAVLYTLQHAHPGLRLGPHNVMLTATHTHAGPSAFSDVVAQNSVNYGFSPVVMTRIVEGIVEAIVEADARREPATLHVASVEIPHAEPVAFNRSVQAYNRNKDVHWVSKAHPEEATRRRSVSLCALDKNKKMFGMINWFAVHATCVHAENTKLHSDNKGIAATLTEAAMGKRADGRSDFVAIFAQDAAGDVTPNFRYDSKRKKVVGVSDNDDESARINGDIQSRYAISAAQKATASPALEGALGGVTRHVDMSHTSVPPQFADGEGRTTTFATWGMGMPAGTAEGPGPMRPLLPMLRAWISYRRVIRRLRLTQKDIKMPFLELGLGVRGRFLSLIPTGRGLGLVGLFDPTIGYVHAIYVDGCLKDEPWLPQILPVQVLRIGSLAILGLCGEPTTIAGMRLRRAMQIADVQGELSEFVINGYANGYAGYITTPEEYELQEYEGSYTTFGRWTLGAYQSIASQLSSFGVSSEPDEPVIGPSIRLNAYELLIERRKVGRKGAWGKGTSKHIPMPDSPYEQWIQRALSRRA